MVTDYFDMYPAKIFTLERSKTKFRKKFHDCYFNAKTFYLALDKLTNLYEGEFYFIDNILEHIIAIDFRNES